MVTQQKLQSQVQAPQTWDKPTAQADVGDYIREPFQPIMIVVDRDRLPDGRVWLLVKPASGSCTEEWIVEQEPALEPQQQQPQQKPAETIQPVGFAGDTVSCQLQPKEKAIADFESGFAHGKLDAANKLEPMCCKADCHYSSGYLAGYNSFHQLKPQPEIKQSIQWRMSWNSKWQWYEVWACNAHIGRASNHEEAERIAQKYIAAEQLRQQHRELVLAAYAG